MTLVRQASLSHGRLTGEAEHAVPRGAHGHRHARHKRGPHLCNRQWGGQSPRHTRGWSAREGGTRWRDIHRPEERGSAANRWEAALRRGVAGDCRRWLHSASRLWIDCLDGGERATIGPSDGQDWREARTWRPWGRRRRGRAACPTPDERAAGCRSMGYAC